jgi:hypothetical protein
MEELVSIHDGQVLRLDGHFKLPRHVKRFEIRGRKRKRRFIQKVRAMIHGTGTTGFMLRRSRLHGGENGESISAIVREVALGRVRYAQRAEAAGRPVTNGGLFSCLFLDANLTYRHRLRRELAHLFPAETVPLADAGPGVCEADAVDMGGELRVIPLWKRVITADAKHISLTAQKDVLVSVVDADSYKVDINDAVMRWMRPKSTVNPPGMTKFLYHFPPIMWGSCSKSTSDAAPTSPNLRPTEETYPSPQLRRPFVFTSPLQVARLVGLVAHYF